MINVPVVSSDQEELKFEGDEGEERSTLTVPEEKRTIRTKSADPEIDSLHGKFKRGKLILQPAFQRLFVWDRTKASKLIESALLDVPIPIVALGQIKCACLLKLHRASWFDAGEPSVVEYRQ